MAFTRCARFSTICLLLDAVLAATGFACFYTPCSLSPDVLAFTRCGGFYKICLLLHAEPALTRRKAARLQRRPEGRDPGQAGKTTFFQKRALQFKGRKGGEFLRKASFGPKIDIVHGGVFEKRFSISLRPRKIAKIAILIIKTRGGVKKNRALSLGPIDWKITSTNCSDRTLFKTLGGGPKAERLCKDGEARYAKMVLLLLI